MPYDPDYAIPESPPLQAIHVAARPSTPPLPFIPRAPPSPICLTAQSKKDRKRQLKRMTRPVLGDTVLLSYMNPNYPDVSQRASHIALNSASHSEASDSDMEDSSPPKRSSRSKRATPEVTVNIARAAEQLLQAQGSTDSSNGTRSKSPDPETRDSQFSPLTSPDVGSLQISALEPDGSEAHRPGTSSSIMKLDGQTPNGNGMDIDSLATSPNLRQHTISDSEGPATEKLPALHSPGPTAADGGPGSPTQIRPLPAFAELEKLAEAASHDHDSRIGSFPHRQSISSVNGQQLPILTQVSPISAHGESSPQDSLYMALSPTSTITSPNFPPKPPYPRRFSHASDALSPYSGSHAGQPTPDGQENGASTHPTPADPAQLQRMSIDATTRVLPLPVASLGTGVAHISAHSGSFKCDFPGCTAAPFQTQYLLSSHANVHSQNRPHYCPVRGCPRGEGGKGFKRKNEMIRHGLVHDSPGYVCPFCPEREHKYPRPDNLQRHVRVHHIDKDKDDPLLRDVLAQRPEGPSRGRRRRVGS